MTWIYMWVVVRVVVSVDVGFLRNGISVAICKTKVAQKSGGLAGGVDQIRRSHKETPRIAAGA
jgi:hypothetical protein